MNIFVIAYLAGAVFAAIIYVLVLLPTLSWQRPTTVSSWVAFGIVFILALVPWWLVLFLLGFAAYKKITQAGPPKPRPDVVQYTPTWPWSEDHDFDVH